MRIFYTASVRKWLLNLPIEMHDRIILKLEFYGTQNNPLVFAKNLGKGFFRFRVGDYRLIFYVKDGMIHIVDIDRRDKIYK